MLEYVYIGFVLSCCTVVLELTVKDILNKVYMLFPCHVSSFKVCRFCCVFLYIWVKKTFYRVLNCGGDECGRGFSSCIYIHNLDR
jgi:hypothetical protein